MKIKYIVVAIIAGISLKANSAIFSPYKMWKKTNIKVCFADQRIHAFYNTNLLYDYTMKNFISAYYMTDYTDKIKEFVNANFTPSQTGIHFTGWKMCSDTKKPDIAILFFDSEDLSHKSYGGIGRPIGKSSTSIISFNKQRLGVNGRPTDVSISSTGLHEFAHAAGLFHENERPEYITHGVCIMTDYDSENSCESPTWRKSKRYSDAVAYGDYDYDSISNYCYNQKMLRSKSVSELSENDKAALYSYYSSL